MYDLYLILLLIFIIFLLVYAISKVSLHPFLTLLFAGLLFGLLSGMEPSQISNSLVEGFGSTLKSIGIVIVVGTIIGVYLEKTGGAYVIATNLLKLFKEKNTPLVMNIMGYIVSIPVFCDSGFVILSPLNKALTKKSGLSLSITAISLSIGLYASHTLVPPTPGPVAAAGIIGADLGLVIMLGIIVSIPVSLSGLAFANIYGKRIYIEPDLESSNNKEDNTNNTVNTKEVSLIKSILPIAIPIILIVLKSISEFPTKPFGESTLKECLQFIGNPSVALLTGFLFCLLIPKKITKDMLSTEGWVGLGVKNAAIIILITAAGGAFGQILRDSSLSNVISNYLTNMNIGLLLPFLIAAALKSAQGSSTVAIITTASLITPLLDPLGLTSSIAKALTVLAIGAGSMVVSHANDSYFWVVTGFSNMTVKEGYKLQTLATLISGFIGALAILILSTILL
ncbi:MAG: GntP family permease [Deferribacterota bacterium]|nr:GntP family permease [Deferribacterota bacterium]